jgi:L-asparaginase / beta-aspartyl-peptidase
VKLARIAGLSLALAILGWIHTPIAVGQNSAAGPADSAVRAILASQQKAWNAADIDTFLLGYWRSAELTFSGSGGVTRGYDGLRERYKKSYPDRAAMGTLDFSELEIRPLGPDAALVLGHWHLTREKGDVGGVFSLVFQKFPDGWKIIHDHTSVVPSEDSPKR